MNGTMRYVAPLADPQYLVRVSIPVDTPHRPTIDDLTTTRHQIIGWFTPEIGVMEPVAAIPRGDNEADYVELPDGEFEAYGLQSCYDLEQCKQHALKYHCTWQAG